MPLGHTHPTIILAGGQSSRMGIPDKGELDLGGERMVDRVHFRLSSQCDNVLISGPRDYGLGLTFIPDLPDAPGGPLAGLYSVLSYCLKRPEKPLGFFTAPVDSPDVPLDLCERLFDRDRSTIAADDAGHHPVFGWWRVEDVRRAFLVIARSNRRSMTGFAAICNCRYVTWPGKKGFINLNAPDDLAQYRLNK